MIKLTKIARKMYNIKPENTKEVLRKLKGIRAIRRVSYWPYGYTTKDKRDRVESLGYVPQGRVKALLNEFKRTGIKDFNVYFKGKDLYIVKQNTFEYIFYNAR